MKRPTAVLPATFKGVTICLTIGMVVIAGTYLLYQGFAATAANSVEPERGTVIAPAVIENDNSASGGQAVAFRSRPTGGGANNACENAMDPYPKPATPANVMTVTQLAARFDAVAQNDINELMSKTVSDESDIYESGYYWEGFDAAFEATCNTKYLDDILPSVNMWIDGAKDSGDGYLGWTNSDSAYADVGGEYPLLDSYGWRFVVRMLYDMKQDPAVMSNPHYKSQYDKILAFTEKNIWEKWYNRGLSDNLYRENTHMASHWAGIGMHLALITNNPTIKQQCLTVARNIMFAGIPDYNGASIKGQMQMNPQNRNAYTWNWDWNQFGPPGSEVDHGEAVVTQAIYAYELAPQLEAAGSPGWKAAWTLQDMTRLKVMFDKEIWTNDSGGAANVDGTGSGNGWWDGYVKLGRFDPALEVRLDNAGDRATGSTWWIGNAMKNALLLRGSTH